MEREQELVQVLKGMGKYAEENASILDSLGKLKIEYREYWELPRKLIPREPFKTGITPDNFVRWEESDLFVCSKPPSNQHSSIKGGVFRQVGDGTLQVVEGYGQCNITPVLQLKRRRKMRNHYIDDEWSPTAWKKLFKLPPRLLVEATLPGCGKTSIVVSALKGSSDKKFLVLNYQNATDRMWQEMVKGLPNVVCTTIDTFFQNYKGSDDTKRDKQTQKIADELAVFDVVVVDEYGCVPIPSLTRVLFANRPKGQRLWFLGDLNQLEAVNESRWFNAIAKQPGGMKRYYQRAIRSHFSDRLLLQVPKRFKCLEHVQCSDATTLQSCADCCDLRDWTIGFVKKITEAPTTVAAVQIVKQTFQPVTKLEDCTADVNITFHWLTRDLLVLPRLHRAVLEMKGLPPNTKYFVGQTLVCCNRVSESKKLKCSEEKASSSDSRRGQLENTKMNELRAVLKNLGSDFKSTKKAALIDTILKLEKGSVDTPVESKSSASKIMQQRKTMIHKNCQVTVTAVRGNTIYLQDTSGSSHCFDISTVQKNFRYSYATTCHGVQGQTADPNTFVTLFQYENNPWVTKQWLVVACTRATRDFTRLFAGEDITHEIDKRLKAAIRNKIETHIVTDREAGRFPCNFTPTDYLKLEDFVHLMNTQSVCPHCTCELAITVTDDTLVIPSPDRIDSDSYLSRKNTQLLCTSECNSSKKDSDESYT